MGGLPVDEFYEKSVKERVLTFPNPSLFYNHLYDLTIPSQWFSFGCVFGSDVAVLYGGKVVEIKHYNNGLWRMMRFYTGSAVRWSGEGPARVARKCRTYLYNLEDETFWFKGSAKNSVYKLIGGRKKSICTDFKNVTFSSKLMTESIGNIVAHNLGLLNHLSELKLLRWTKQDIYFLRYEKHQLAMCSVCQSLHQTVKYNVEIWWTKHDVCSEKCALAMFKARLVDRIDMYETSPRL